QRRNAKAASGWNGGQRLASILDPWYAIAILAKGVQNRCRREGNERPPDQGSEPHEVHAHTGDRRRTTWVFPDRRPGRCLREIGVGQLPDRANLVGGFAQG